MLKDPPSFVRNRGAWEYTLAKLATKQEEDGKMRLDAYGNPLNYAAAVAIYKNVCKKYPAFQTDNLTAKPIKTVGNQGDTTGDFTVYELCEKYPVGQMFWFDDVLCEAVSYSHSLLAVYPNADGTLFVRGKILDVDPEGKHRKWPIGKINGFPPHRCSNLMEGAER